MENNKEIAELSAKLDIITEALIGDKLKRKIGALDQIDTNVEDIRLNSHEIIRIKESSRTPWTKLGVASGAGVGLGGLGTTKGGALISKFVELFT